MLFLIGFIAIVPGFMNTFLIVSLALDKRPDLPPLKRVPSSTEIITAYKEVASIKDTVCSLMKQTYEGPFAVTVINDWFGAG